MIVRIRVMQDETGRWVVEMDGREVLAFCGPGAKMRAEYEANSLAQWLSAPAGGSRSRRVAPPTTH